MTSASMDVLGLYMDYYICDYRYFYEKDSEKSIEYKLYINVEFYIIMNYHEYKLIRGQ